MWRELIRSLCPASEFAPPATPEQLAEAEAAVGVALPPELADLLRESNGVAGDYGLGLVWSAERIAADNARFRLHPDFRLLYMPFDPLLFFGDAGNGDQFALAITAGVVRRPDVFVWDHETDSRSWVAPSLKVYLEWWLTGRLRI